MHTDCRSFLMFECKKMIVFFFCSLYLETSFENKMKLVNFSKCISPKPGLCDLVEHNGHPGSFREEIISTIVLRRSDLLLHKLYINMKEKTLLLLSILLAFISTLEITPNLKETSYFFKDGLYRLKLGVDGGSPPYTFKFLSIP